MKLEISINSAVQNCHRELFMDPEVSSWKDNNIHVERSQNNAWTSSFQRGGANIASMILKKIVWKCEHHILSLSHDIQES